MKDLLAGLFVLGLVLSGVFWARGWRLWADPDADVHDAALARATDAVPMPDIGAAEGIVQVGDVRITLTVSPRPPVAFDKNVFRVRVESNRRPVPLEHGRISFEMAMPMGDHRYALVAGADGWQEAEVVLPMCPSGRSRWYASVEGSIAGQSVSARFQFDLAKPEAAPALPAAGAPPAGR